METTKPGVRYIYQLDTLQSGQAGRCSAAIIPASSQAGAATGAVIRGERIQVALVTRTRASRSAVHTEATEQFAYVMRGALVAEIGGESLCVPEGHVLHVPAGMPHGIAASADGDATYYVMKDTGAAFDSAGSESAERSPVVSSAKVQYVYDIARLEAVPEGRTSAQVVPRNFISGKSSSYGAALKGAKLQVGHVHKAVGSGTKLHTHPNEQFSFVLEGTMHYEIDGAKLEAPPRSATHLPAGIVHGAIASAAGDVLTFVAKDMRHGMSGPPIDGVEDGPVYLPGFDPRKR